VTSTCTAFRSRAERDRGDHHGFGEVQRVSSGSLTLQWLCPDQTMPDENSGQSVTNQPVLQEPSPIHLTGLCQVVRLKFWLGQVMSLLPRERILSEEPGTPAPPRAFVGARLVTAPWPRRPLFTHRLNFTLSGPKKASHRGTASSRLSRSAASNPAAVHRRVPGNSRRRLRTPEKSVRGQVCVHVEPRDHPRRIDALTVGSLVGASARTRRVEPRDVPVGGAHETVNRIAGVVVGSRDHARWIGPVGMFTRQ
jgi:hypothetical protein